MLFKTDINKVAFRCTLVTQKRGEAQYGVGIKHSPSIKQDQKSVSRTVHHNYMHVISSGLLNYLLILGLAFLRHH